MPTISVVIPAYNRARYLGDTIRSVLDQTRPPDELIVVDDGSTDETPVVIASFGAQVRGIQQPNRGAATARNVGLHAATGDAIAFLDSDDQWLPPFLETMSAELEAQPGAKGVYSAARCVDSDGNLLPQRAGVPADQTVTLKDALLRSNFLLPSTMLLNREAVVSVGGFDVSLRRLQDWDLWLRMVLRGDQFVRSDACLTLYRVHGESLSANIESGQRSMLALAEKHFGPDDGRYATWSGDKRRFYGGAHAFNATVAVLHRGDWAHCRRETVTALRMDPTLAIDRDFFYELALGPQPVGRRTPNQVRGALPDRVGEMDALVDAIEGGDGLSESTKRDAAAAAYGALGLLAYNAGELALSRQMIVRAVRYRPNLLTDRLLLGNLGKSLLGPAILDRLRRTPAA